MRLTDEPRRARRRGAVGAPTGDVAVPQTVARPLGYRAGLDGLRAFAILFVMLHHTSDLLVTQWHGDVFSGGFLGVDLFFVLSGYLITTLLIERRERAEPRPLRSFYARRALRLLPAVVVFLIGNLVVSLVEGKGLQLPINSFLVVMTYTTNWVELHGWPQISQYVLHLWSLAIEEQFYLVWPVLLFGVWRAGLSRRTIGWLAVVLAALSTYWCAHLWWDGRGYLAIYIRTDARASSILVGAALAVFRVDRFVAWVPRLARTVIGFLALGAVVFAASEFHADSEYLYIGGFTVFAIVCAVLIAVEVDGEWLGHRLLSARPLVTVGRLSYSLYLWHFLVFLVVADDMADAESWQRVGVGWSASVALAAASFAFVERPALRLKDRIGRATKMEPVTPGSGS